MTNIFSLLKESSISDTIFSSKYSKEKYVESYINTLKFLNEAVSKETMTLYTKISEAENVKEENEAIKNFISQIQVQLDNLALKISSTTSRFSIAVSNYCDIAKQMTNNIPSSEIDSRISFTGKYLEYETSKLLDSNIPKMNPYLIFEKEFNLIAQLMQDLPITASNKDKLNAIATVCDKFNGFMSKSIEQDVYRELIYQNEEGPNPLSSSVLSIFRSKEPVERSITIKDYQNAVSCISNCDQFISSITEMSDKLINDLRHIISDLNDIISGCDRNKFKVDTRQDGIRNTIYSVDTYASNKIMWLVQEKVRQIANTYDKYIIALSVKMECILSYIRQSSDIIETFSYIDAKCSRTDNKNGTVLSKPDDSSEDDLDLGQDDSENMDTTGKEVTENEERESKSDNALDGGDDFLTPEDETDNDVGAGDIKDPVPNFAPSEYGEFEEAMMEFSIGLYECFTMMQQAIILEHAVSLLEEDNDGEQTVKAFGTMNEKKRSAWRKCIDQLVKIWQKFKEAFTTTYQEKVNELNKNESLIAHPPFDHEISMPVIRHENIDKIKIPDLNPADIENGNLKDNETFLNSCPELQPFSKDKGQVLSLVIKETVIDPKETYDNANKVDPMKIYNEYCKGFMDRYNNMKVLTDSIEKAQKVADDISKKMAKAIKTESNIITADIYFTEAETKMEVKKEEDNKNKTEDGKKEEEKKDDSMSAANIEKCLHTYFDVCGTVVSSKMYICQRVFDEYYAYLKWHIDKALEDRKEEEKKEATSGSSGEGGGTKEEEKPAKFD